MIPTDTERTRTPVGGAVGAADPAVGVATGTEAYEALRRPPANETPDRTMPTRDPDADAVREAVERPLRPRVVTDA